MKRIITLCCMLLGICMTTTLQAVPAKRGIQTVEQPDGTNIRIELHGDEHFHFTTTEDGYLVRQNAQGVYEYAVFTAEQIIQPMGVKVHSIDQRTEAEKHMLHQARKAKDVFQHNQPIAAMKKRQNVCPIHRKPGIVNLVPRGLVLLVEYADTKLHTESTQAAFSDMLNGDNYTYDNATGSVKKYFSDQSNGLYIPEFDVIGPITLSKNMAYYGQNTQDGQDINSPEMVNEACSIANAKFGADFTRYDGNNDGNVDFVFLIYAGYAEAQGADANTIWPHQWDISYTEIPAQNRQYDGKYISNYACTSELRGNSGTTRDGIGTFCHEFSHIIGMPDYYDVDYGYNNERGATLGQWSLMDGGNYNNNGKTPPNYSAYDKYYLGWVTPTILNTKRNVILAADGQTYYAVTANGTLPNATASVETWYLENRQQTGWDKYLPGHGLLVVKVMYNATIWQNNTINNSRPVRVDIIEADAAGSYGLGASYPSDGTTFPGSLNKTHLVITGEYNLTNIVETSGNISFNFMGELPEPHHPITVHWKNTNNWSSAYLYAWLPTSNNTPVLGTWPGIQLKPDSNDWYSYTFDQNVDAVNFIFHERENGIQTQDLYTETDVCYQWDDVQKGMLMDCPEDLGDVPQLREPITIRWKNTDNWASVHLYAWLPDMTNTQVFGEWPGKQLEPDKDGWYSYTFEAEITGVNFIFHSGDGIAQTKDLYTEESVCYQWDTTNQKGVVTDCPAELNTDPITIRFKQPAEWSDAYLYAWLDGGTQILGAWPGLQLPQPDTQGWSSYTFEDGITSVNFIFNSGEGGVQSADLTTTKSICYEWQDGIGAVAVDCNELTTAAENVPAENISNVQKVFENGTIYILRNGEKYTVDGRKVSTI